MSRRKFDDSQLIETVLACPGFSTLELAHKLDFDRSVILKYLKQLEHTGRIVHRERGRPFKTVIDGRHARSYIWYVWPGPKPD